MSPYIGPMLLPLKYISKWTSHNNAHRARDLKLPRHWNTTLWRECLAAWEFRCAYCGRVATSQDHFIPLHTKGNPGTVPWNMVPACGRCNFNKSSKDPWNWMFEKGFDNRWGTVVAYLCAMKGKYGYSRLHNNHLHYL